MTTKNAQAAEPAPFDTCLLLMPIHAPGRVLLTRLPLKSVRARVHKTHAAAAFEPLSAPLIDVLLVLTFFLLQFFEGSGEVCEHTPLALPTARHTIPLELAPVIRIDAAHVTLDGLRVTDTAVLLARADSPPIAALVEQLKMVRRNFALLYPFEGPTDDVLIFAPRELPFRALRSVLASSREAGYGQASFAVELRTGPANVPD
jgi:biopolymer transport protein ExbD